MKTPLSSAHAYHASDDVIVRDIRLYAFNNKSMAGRIFMKFIMDIMPLLTTPKLTL
jgi:hypothetical protein